ncbi:MULTISPECIES: hypothetical protein [Vibrio harveyi group]|uniref:Transposase n=1 Tax=Vibrio hippocampi TaxID=654686 RepID=A0ABM8ZMI9_9VIBR|nr:MULTISPECIES: hypothetical protein [Vibrio harveyi group]EKM20647.1 hypothetical protein VCHENC01_4561 [Vibrio harveyi]MCS0269901.1 hypothetical protein [Vibrio alginolyticus]CAH0529751.1 hypothetical protein VHP8226_03507 [Vibrio hippocampi]CAH1549178.1 hypothetical protein THOE12_10215 [Vibrio rotiferianus]|tara:strand:- start:1052 stop:1213 length:162 start_codon:yes stop_codon:yes gene_type:complete
MTNVKSRKTRKAYTPEEAALFAKAANAAAKQIVSLQLQRYDDTPYTRSKKDSL